MPNVQLPDGSVKSYPAGSSALDVARSISERLAKATIAAQVDGIADLSTLATLRALHESLGQLEPPAPILASR